MQKRWSALVLAALMLVTTSCGPRPAPEDTSEPVSSASQEPPADVSSQVDAEEPVKPPPTWETGRTVEDMPDLYHGLELPVQGATGYAPVEMALWADPADQEAAALAVEEWETAQEEAARLAEEQAKAAEEAAQQQAQQGGETAQADPAASGTGSDAVASAPQESADSPVPTNSSSSSSSSSAAPAGETGGQEGAASPADGAPAVPGELPQEGEASAGDPSAVQEPSGETPGQEPAEGTAPTVPETPEEPEVPGEAEPEPPAEEEEPPTLTDGALALLTPGTAFTVLQEEGDWWQIAVTTDYFTDEEQTETQRGEITGWVEHQYCFINLPDVIPSIIYDATNSYSSHFVTCGKWIPEVTGEAFYPSKTYNQRLDKMEFMMPVLYSMAFKLCAAQQSALAEGNSLILYEGYRPHAVQTKVLNSLSAMTRTDEEVKEAVTGAPWRISWFISGGYSNHQRGYAVDMGLAKVTETKEYTAGGYRYVRVWNYERYEMPTPIHELSRAAATYTAPVAINSTTAWKNAELSTAMAANESALGLQRYCTDAELTPLASEWWHFNDLSTRSQVLENQGIGDFVVSSVRSTAPG